VKTHAHLLVRDALARAFVAAASGEAAARATLAALPLPDGESRRGEAPCDLRAEDGTPLFEAGGALGPRFTALEPYLRDRARRYRAALEWIDAGRGGSGPIERARAAWDAGLFFEVHELLEPEWLAREPGPERERLRALIMAGAALHHLSEGNRAGALGLLRDAARRLETAPERDEYAWRPFGAGLAALADSIERAGSGRPVPALLPAAIPRLERA
jgi:hypothetical protein